jgi:hypothetical protein
MVKCSLLLAQGRDDGERRAGDDDVQREGRPGAEPPLFAAAAGACVARARARAGALLQVLQVREAHKERGQEKAVEGRRVTAAARPCNGAWGRGVEGGGRALLLRLVLALTNSQGRPAGGRAAARAPLAAACGGPPAGYRDGTGTSPPHFFSPPPLAPPGGGALSPVPWWPSTNARRAACSLSL